jgi:ribosomal protein L19
MDLLQEIIKPYLRNDLPPLKTGEKIEVVTKIFDKNNEKEEYKLSAFRGVIISQKRPKQISYNFAVLKESKKLVVKQTFFYHSPLIASIKKMGVADQKVRRAKLYFLERKLAAKKAGE